MIEKNNMNLAMALSKAQAVMGPAIKNKTNPHFKTKYADLAAVIDATRKPFADNGLAVTQIIDHTDTALPVLITRLMHESGEYLEGRMLMPPMVKAQEYGSTLTYYRRYALSAIAGIASDDDDDGNHALESAPAKPIKKEPAKLTLPQIKEIKQMLEGRVELEKQVLQTAGILSLDMLPADRFDGCKDFIRKSIDKSMGVK